MIFVLHWCDLNYGTQERQTSLVSYWFC